MIALTIWQLALEEMLTVAGADGLPPVSIAICDFNAQLKLFARMDGAPIRSITIAHSKAYTAAMLGTTTAALYDRLQTDKIELGFFCDSKLTAFPGGSPVFVKSSLGGAIGISGRKPADDQVLAAFGANLVEDLLIKP